MTDSSVLGDIAIGYSPMIDKSRNVAATRLTIYSHRTAFPSPDAAQLLDELSKVWPDGLPRLSLDVLSEGMLADLLGSGAAGGVPGGAASHAATPCLLIEVPFFMAAEPVHAAAIVRQHARGTTMLLKGASGSGLPREAAACFGSRVVDLGDDRRLRGSEAPTASAGQVLVYSGVDSIEDMDDAFRRGATALFGWPVGDAVSPGATSNKPATPPDLSVIADLIAQVDRQERIENLELTLRRDPTLAFKLVRFINSPAFGLRVEISSFRHAIMMLGYQRLKRWLALLLVTASKDANQRPSMFAAVRRGLLMEELMRGSGDEEMRNELFICGVFSLLDRMFSQPFEELLRAIPVPQRVYQALAENAGPYHAYLELARAIESASLFDMNAAAETLMLDFAEINGALLRALAAASQLD